MKIMKKLVLFSALLCLGYCAHIDLDAYPFSSVLKADSEGSPLYTLYWNFSTSEQTITFAVKARTDGWVGFGVSPNGGMINSDVVIGWVNDEGQAFLHDRYALEQSRPPVDPQQDWNLIKGENENGFTTLEFWRNWITCDENDRDIEASTARVVFSWSENDPANDDSENGPVNHGVSNRGSASLNLLGGLTNIPPEPPIGTVGSFNITVDNVLIPSTDTTYWCAVFELPQDIQNQERYIIRYSPIISPNEFQYVHHLLVYLCDTLEVTDVGASAPCSGTTASQCLLSGEVIAAWAVGGNDFIYPQGVAYPIGGSSGQRFLVMQVHYDNPMGNSTIRDSSGVQFIYETAPRPFNAGILLLGHRTNRRMIIPPSTTNYGVSGVCSSNCTSRYLPEGGIKIFANLLHTHLVGRGLTLRILRPTQQCDGGLEELKPVDQNLQYDFNYQQFTYLPEEITVYPGDVLVLDCNYTTTDREGVVLGGESTREEMCLSFPVYYPRARLTTCISNPVDQSIVSFTQQFTPDQSAQQAILQALYTNTSAFQTALDQYIDWTPEAAAALEESIRSGPMNILCLADQPDESFNEEQTIPAPQCPYNATSVCPLISPTSPTDAAPKTDKAFGLAASVLNIIGVITLTLVLL